ncbi:superoxide dismutase [Neoroseomonas oryzicola]|uniref:Superoxide dismutase n=1 Tax=Neoroseomonas oryzicola TaxID=535904 RepID=A0A9X9WPA9_9PROT|nr:superoxide dismutase [Neoroseomonas oryzicola]NKE18075.1 superoxide dismutase [Neoroseomonas oryzicola]
MTTMHRRGLLFGAAGLAAMAATRRPAYAQAPAGPFTLPALPYAPNANERAIDAMTMEIHHGRHHAAYVANLNAAVKDHSALAQMPVDEILMRLSQVPEAVRTAIRNNGGGHANHSMFWEIMGGEGGEPTGDLKAAIDRDLGGMEKFRTDFNTAGTRVFGSGWVFVAVTPGGNLSLVSKPNQDTPLMDGGRVLMGNDVWEHAYYLRYQNRRADYLTAWWNVLNWEKIAARYEAAKNGTLRV